MPYSRTPGGWRWPSPCWLLSAHVHKLILHPGQPDVVPARVDELVDTLRAMELIDGEFAVNDGVHYHVGARFLDLIIFLGCSPSVALSPEEARGSPEAFCQVVVDGPLDRACLRVGELSVRPRCPHCRAAFSGWEPCVRAWLRDPGRPAWSCRACDAKLLPHEFDYRHGAGVGRIFLEVWGIYPQEAVPADPLLRRLAALTNCQWQYFYSRH